MTSSTSTTPPEKPKSTTPSRTEEAIHKEDLYNTDTRDTREAKDVEAAREGSVTDVQWTFNRIVAIGALCIAYVGSQLLLYFTGGSLSYIAAELNIKYVSWIPAANLLAISSTLPFVGYITDFIGRRWAAIFGCFLLVLGSILEASCYSFAQGIMGMILGGIGAGICELTAFAGIAEITPVKFRGLSLALVTLCIAPFGCYVLYVQLLQLHSTWRWGLALVGFWNAAGFFGLLFCYHPPPRPNAANLTRKEIAKRIDYIGAFISIGGVTLILVGLQAGGYQYPWKSAKVLAPLIVGILILSLFPVYELYFAKYPMVPRDIFNGQKVVGLSFVIAFVAGMNFYSILNFYPLVLTTYYKPDPVLVGVRAIGYGYSILAGAVLVNALLSYTHGHVRSMLTISCVIMTAFGGALAASTPTNPGLATAFSTIAGFGIGGVLIPATTLAMIASPDDFIATTTAIALSVRFVGGAVGNTVYFNIYNSKLATKLPAYVAKYAIEAGLPSGSVAAFTGMYLQASTKGAVTPDTFQGIDGVTIKVIEAAALGGRYAYADSIRYIWYTSVAFGGVACICCMFLPNIKRFLTNRVAVDIH